MSRVLEKATAHLAVVFGPTRAAALVDECLTEAGLMDAQETDELLRLGNVFMKRGGFFEVVGRFLRVQAISAECAGPRELGARR